MVKIKSLGEIELMRESALVVSQTWVCWPRKLSRGNNYTLDQLAESFIRDLGAEPGFWVCTTSQHSLCQSQRTGRSRYPQ